MKFAPSFSAPGRASQTRLAVATNVLNTTGNFTITATNAATPGTPQQFYILQAQ